MGSNNSTRYCPFVPGGTLPADESIWTGKKPEVEPSKDEEYDEYFRDMFL